jgi:hypothetical protein
MSKSAEQETEKAVVKKNIEELSLLKRKGAGIYIITRQYDFRARNEISSSSSCKE